MNMYKVGKYFPNDLMSDLICDNYPMLLVMSRFGIDLGFGDDSIDDVCRKSEVDVYTFLAVVNVLIARDKNKITLDFNQLSLAQIVRYLHNSHAHFLEYRLPSIRRKLVESIDNCDDVSVVLVNYYDEYLSEVRKHMMYEENTLFPYIKSMAEGVEIDSKYSIDEYSSHHDNVEAKLSEFKNIIIKYYPAKTTNELNSVLCDIFSCESDLASHNDIENYLLVPAIRSVEEVKQR